MCPGEVGGLIPQEEIERFKKEYDKTHPFPSCVICKHKQIIVLKYRKYKGEIYVKESTEKCELNLDYESGFAMRRAVECVDYEAGENQYIIKKRE